VEPAGASKTISTNGHAAHPHPGSATLVDTDGHGSHQPPDVTVGQPRSPRPPGPSTRPALIVVGIALGLLIAGTVASGLAGSQGGGPPKHSSITAKGSPLKAEAAKPSLSVISSAGAPPANILDALTLPVGSKVTPGSSTNAGLGPYDRSLSFVVADTEQKVIDFFRVQLHADLWSSISQGPPRNGPGFQIIGQHPGSDGYEWELGVTVLPETFPQSAGPGVASTGETPFTFRLFQVPDQD
jgi:hypothetical protein